MLTREIKSKIVKMGMGRVDPLVTDPAQISEAIGPHGSALNIFWANRAGHD
jgi:hypothetical protein